MLFKNHRSKISRIILTLIVVSSILIAQPARKVHAATLIVTNNFSSGDGSLFQTINNASPGDTITFDPSLSGATISWFSKSLTKNITIDAMNLNLPVTLDGGGAVQLFQIASGITAEFKNMNFINGAYNGLGELLTTRVHLNSRVQEFPIAVPIVLAVPFTIPAS